MASVPVSQSRIFSKNIAGAAEGKIKRGLLDNINISQDKNGRHAGHGFLIAFPGHSGNRGAEAVYTGGRGTGNEGDFSVVCTISGSIVDGSASDGNQIINIFLKLLHHLSHCDFVGMEIGRIEKDGEKLKALYGQDIETAERQAEALKKYLES